MGQVLETSHAPLDKVRGALQSILITSVPWETLQIQWEWLQPRKNGACSSNQT